MEMSIRRHSPLVGPFKLSVLSVLAAAALAACGGGGGTDTAQVTSSGPVPPQITAQPQNATVNSGQTATFSVTASGTAPMTYQWMKNSTNIGGATSASYTTPGTSSSDNGASFTVMVTNSAGSITSSAATLTVSGGSPAAQTITFNNPGTQTVGTPLTLIATATSGLTVSFASQTTSVCTVSGTMATYVAAGTCTIQATQAGNSTYAAATPVAQSFTVNAASGGPTAQTITFNNPGTQTVGTPLTLTATATSGLTVSFASQTTSICTVSGTTATFVAAGTCTIQATQAGNSTYAAATPVSQSFTVNAASGQKAATPTFSVPGGVYTSAQSVTMTCSTPSSTIYYTANGTTPTHSSSVYSAAITVSATETLEAICAASGYTDSAAASATYTINLSGTYVLPANRVTTWKPGVTYNGGIPNRTTIYTTLSPLGAGKDDTAQINAALAACPANEVVQLTAGVFLINGNGINFNTPNCTLRGAGPGKQLNTGVSAVESTGSYVVDATATQLVKADRATNINYAVLYLSPAGVGFGASINLAADAALGAASITLASNPGIQVGEIILIDEVTDSHPDVVWGPSFGPAGDGSRRWFSRQDRSISQLVEVSAVSGNTITFNTPLHSAFQTAYTAQATRYTAPFLHGAGVENLFVWGGMGGDFHGNISVSLCAYCWVKNVEASWSVGTDIGFYSTFRSELRDSFIHETPSPDPGGGGYLTGINVAASDNLFENNIMWYGDKVDVMRASGGGNVLAYNYLDDAFGATFPESPEAGVNAGHYTTPHMELLEGNYSFAYKGDTYWGNSIYITVFRNWLSGQRAARAPLSTYDYKSGTCDYLYGDYVGRAAVSVQAYSYYTNFVGNVLGKQNQTLLTNPLNSQNCYNGLQSEFLEFSLTSAEDSSAQNADAVMMWEIGNYQATVNTTGNWSFVDTTINTQLRDGNWDWVTKAQHWYGLGTNTDGTDPGQPLPNSLYLPSVPAFFGSNTWPWVDPTTGTTYTLPAMYCFQHNQMPTCMP